MTGQRHYGRHAAREAIRAPRPERNQGESKDIYEAAEEGRGKRLSRGGKRKRETENAPAAFICDASNTLLHLFIHRGCTHAADGAQLCVYPRASAREDRDGEPEQRERRERRETGREEKDKLGNSGHFYTFYLLWPPCLSAPALSVPLASCCEPRGVQENIVTPKKGESRERDSTIIGRGNGLPERGREERGAGGGAVSTVGGGRRWWWRPLRRW